MRSPPSSQLVLLDGSDLLTVGLRCERVPVWDGTASGAIRQAVCVSLAPVLWPAGARLLDWYGAPSPATTNLAANLLYYYLFGLAEESGACDGHGQSILADIDLLASPCALHLLSRLPRWGGLLTTQEISDWISDWRRDSAAYQRRPALGRDAR